MGTTREAVEEKGGGVLMSFFPWGGLRILSSSAQGSAASTSFLSSLPPFRLPTLWHPALV